MSLIEWRPEFLIGLPKIDADHRRLIELINQLYNELQSGQHQATVVDFLGEVYANTAKHFAHEEAVMRAHDYEGYMEHQADHQRLLDEVNEMMIDYQDGVQDDHDVIAKRLHDWFYNHFRDLDSLLHRALTIE